MKNTTLKKKKTLKKNAVIVIICMFFSITNLYSQDNHKLTYSQYFEYTYSAYHNMEYLTHDANFVYFYELRKSNKYIKFNVYDLKTTEEKINKEIDLPPQYRDSKIIGLSLSDEKLYILTSFFNKKTDMTYYFSESFNITTGISNGDLAKIFELPEMKKNVSSDLLYSENKKHIAYVLHNNSGLDMLGSYAFVMDDKFKIQYSYDNLFNDLSGYSIIEGGVLSNKGVLYYAVKRFPNLDAAKQGVKIKYAVGIMQFNKCFINNPNYNYYILSADKKNKPNLFEVIPPKDKFIRYLTVMDKDSLTFITGALSNKNDYNYSGIFSYLPENDSWGAIEIENYNEFSEEFQKQYLDNKDMELYVKAKSDKKNNAWDYHEFANRSFCEFNHGYVLFLEQWTSFWYTTGSGRTTSSVLVSQQDYVYATYVDEEGKIIETIKIPKKQTFPGYKTFMSSYKVIGNKLYFLFTDMDFLKPKYQNMILYVYDKDFNKKTYQIVFPKEYKYGFTTSNEWIGDYILLGKGQKNMAKFQYMRVDFSAYK